MKAKYLTSEKGFSGWFPRSHDMNCPRLHLLTILQIPQLHHPHRYPHPVSLWLVLARAPLLPGRSLTLGDAGSLGIALLSHTHHVMSSTHESAHGRLRQAHA